MVHSSGLGFASLTSKRPAVDAPVSPIGRRASRYGEQGGEKGTLRR